jgi:hypothetical protein
MTGRSIPVLIWNFLLIFVYYSKAKEMNKFLVMSAIAVASLAAVSCKPTVKAPQKPDYQMSYTVGDVTSR